MVDVKEYFGFGSGTVPKTSTKKTSTKTVVLSQLKSLQKTNPSYTQTTVNGKIILSAPTKEYDKTSNYDTRKFTKGTYSPKVYEFDTSGTLLKETVYTSGIKTHHGDYRTGYVYQSNVKNYVKGSITKENTYSSVHTSNNSSSVRLSNSKTYSDNSLVNEQKLSLGKWGAVDRTENIDYAKE